MLSFSTCVIDTSFETFEIIEKCISIFLFHLFDILKKSLFNFSKLDSKLLFFFDEAESLSKYHF